MVVKKKAGGKQPKVEVGQIWQKGNDPETGLVEVEWVGHSLSDNGEPCAEICEIDPGIPDDVDASCLEVPYIVRISRFNGGSRGYKYIASDRAELKASLKKARKRVLAK